MMNREDIGTLLKEKLHGAQKPPSTTLWDRVDATLNKKEKKQKRIFWLLTGSGILLLVMTLLYAVAPRATSNSSQERNASEELTKVNGASEIGLKPSNESIVNKASKTEMNSEEVDLEKTISEETISSQSPKEKNLKLEKNTPSSKKRKMIVTKNNSGEHKITDKDYSVKTTYYYYNGENKEQITTTDKKTIDSILKATENLKDTLN